jgi:hypothetical protein
VNLRSIRLLATTGKVMCLIALVLSIAVKHARPRTDRPMLACIELELAGLGTILSAACMWRDVRTGESDRAGLALKLKQAAREAPVARESSNAAQIDVSHDSKDD